MRKFSTFAVCLGLISTAVSSQQTVDIDVEPGSASNSVRPDSDQAIVISIYSADGTPPGAFDAQQVDPATITFGPGNATNFSVPAIHDSNGDTYADLTVAFRTSESGIACNDTSVSLSGETYGGVSFTGSDIIETADCPSTCHSSDAPERLATPLVVGDSMSDDPADWWNLAAELDPIDFEVFATLGEELGRHSSNPSRGMVRNLASYFATASTADSLIIFGGTNDSAHSAHAGEMKFAMSDMIDLAKRQPNIRDIIIISPTPYAGWSGYAGWTAGKQAQQDEYMAWLPQFAADEEVHYLDAYNLLNDPWYSDYLFEDFDSGDSVHLNVIGALQIASAVDALIVTSRNGPEAGPLQVAQQSIGWDTSRRSYDGLTVVGSELTWSRTVSGMQSIPADLPLPAAGKWYTEVLITSIDASSNARIGLVRESTHGASWSGGLGSDDGPQPAIKLSNARGMSNGSVFGSTLPDVEAGTVVGIAYDADANLAWINVNGHWQEQTSVNALPDVGSGGIAVADATDYLVAIQITSGNIKVEFPDEIPAGHVPKGFSTIY